MAVVTKLARIDRPFTGGLKDDPTGPRDAAELEDALFPLGIACERGGYGLTGASVASSSALRVWEDVIGAGVQGSSEPEADMMFAGTTTVTIATDTDADQNILLPSVWDHDANTQGYRLMPGTFNGEVLILPLDGLSPIMTYARNVLRTTATALSFTMTAGSNVLTCTSASLAATDVGAFVYIAQGHGCRRIVAFVDTTHVIVDSPWTHTLVAATGSILPVGVLNLFAQVAKGGTASKVGTITTVTGTQTQWTAFPQGEVDVQAGSAGIMSDYIAPIGVDYGTPLGVNGVASDTSLTVESVTPPTWGASAVNYVVGRHMPGRVACVHKSRLYVAGFRPSPGRLYVSPPRWDGRTPKNGEFSYEVEIGKAMMMAFVDVPDPFTKHEITGLLSLPSGNLAVLTSSGSFAAWGEYPAMTVQKTSDFANLSPESTLAAEGGAWMAGPEGIFEFRNQNTPSLISGDIDRRWRAVADDSSNPVDNIALGYYDGHLLCSAYKRTPTDTGRTFVWDIRRRVWCGEWSLGEVESYYYSSAPRAHGGPFGGYPQTGPTRLIMGKGGTQAYDLSTAFVDHDTAMTVTTNPGAFVGQTPFDFSGDLSVEREAKYVKVQHQMTGADGEADVIPGPDGTIAATTLTQTTGDTIESTIAFPTTDLGGSANTLGQRTNRFDVRIERNAGTITKFAVHEIECEVKEYRRRG